MNEHQMRFKIEPKTATSSDFLFFMSQSHLRVEFNTETNEVSVEIPTESPEEVEKLIRNINNFFNITGFSSGKDLHFIQNSQIHPSDSEKKTRINFSFLKEECSEKALNKLAQTIYWACNHQNVPETDIINFFIWQVIKEISLHYTNNAMIDLHIGDVVSVINASSIIDDIPYTQGIVCNIIENSFFIIPIIECDNEHCFSGNEIDFFNTEFYKKSYKINYESSRFLSKIRIENVIGKTTTDFLTKILANLKKTYSFMQPQHTHTIVPNQASLGIQENALFETFKTAFEKLSKTADFEHFFEEINLKDELLKELCIKCPTFNKITWNTLNEELANKPNCTQDNLKNAFKKWLDTQPTLKEKCSTLSFTSLLKVIKKTLNK